MKESNVRTLSVDALTIDSASGSTSDKRFSTAELLRRERVLSIVSSMIIESPDLLLDSRIERGFRIASKFIGACTSAFFVVSEKGQVLKPQTSWAYRKEPRPAILEALSLSVSEWLMRQLRRRQIVVLDDTQEFPSEAFFEQTLFAESGMSQVVFVPVMFASSLGAVLAFCFERSDPVAPLKNLRSFFRVVADVASTALERKRSNARLSRNLNQLQSFVQSNPMPVAMFDRKMRYLIVSQQWCEQNRVTPEQIIGKCHYDVERNIRPRWREVHKQCLAGKGASSESDVYVRPDGRTEWIRWKATPWFEDSTEVGGIILFVETITKQNRDAELFKKVIDLNPNLIFAKDREGRFTLVNEAVAKAYGTTADELIGKTDADFNPNEEEVAHFRAVDEEVWRAREPKVVGEEVLTDASGKKRWLHTVKLPILSDDGETTSILGVATDITAVKEVEEERVRLEHEVSKKQRLESLGILAGGISHDFNNLLMGVLGNASIIQGTLEKSSPMRERVEQIRTAALRAAELTNQLLAYSGRGKFVISSIDLNSVVREMMTLLSSVISRDANISLELDDSLRSFEGDISQIRQVIMNLITNASDALGDRQGQITIQTKQLSLMSDELRELEFENGKRSSEYVMLRVSDSGCGMEEEDLERIFDPFFTTKFTGRGLGLSAALGIVKGHNGELRVLSKKGQGSCFEIYFPSGQSAAEEMSRSSASVPEETETLGLNVLVCDDEAMTRSVVSEMLSSLGCEVLTAVDGEEVMEVAERQQGSIDAIVLDMTMPKRSGAEALKLLAKAYPQVPIILSSGYAETEVRDRVGEDYVFQFLQKPYQLTDLKSVLMSATVDEAPGLD